jgi:hypothetical protein
LPATPARDRAAGEAEVTTYARWFVKVIMAVWPPAGF